MSTDKNFSLPEEVRKQFAQYQNIYSNTLPLPECSFPEGFAQAVKDQRVAFFGDVIKED